MFNIVSIFNSRVGQRTRHSGSSHSFFMRTQAELRTIGTSSLNVPTTNSFGYSVQELKPDMTRTMQKASERIEYIIINESGIKPNLMQQTLCCHKPMKHPDFFLSPLNDIKYNQNL